MSNVKLVQTGKYEFMDGFQLKKKKEMLQTQVIL